MNRALKSSLVISSTAGSKTVPESYTVIIIYIYITIHNMLGKSNKITK